MGYWSTEIEPHKRISCISRAKNTGMRLARMHQRPIYVHYHGPKRVGNRNVLESDFTIDGRGIVDPTVDPHWWTHHQGAG